MESKKTSIIRNFSPSL